MDLLPVLEFPKERSKGNVHQTKSSLVRLELAFSPMGAFPFRVEFHRLTGVQGPFHADVGMHSTARVVHRT
jgi:hypothetical protein